MSVSVYLPVCMYVCLFAFFKDRMFELYEIFVHVTCGRRSVLR